MLPCWRLLPFWPLLQVPPPKSLPFFLPCLHLPLSPLAEEALRFWKVSSGPVDPPTGKAINFQRAWDRLVAVACASSLVSQATSMARARLLASQQKQAGAWLTALPVSALGLRMENDCIRVAVGLWLGSALCLPHACAQCGSEVDETGVHALSCRKSRGRLPCHHSLNDIIKRALVAIDVPCTLEPRGLCRGDGRRPDRISIIPWAQGRCLVWDATCHDTFAPTNIPFSTKGAGIVADRAAYSKRLLYSDLCQSYIFIPFAVESAGSFGKDALDFLSELGRRTRLKTKDPLSYLKLCQNLSMCIQRFDTVFILGCSCTELV